LLTGCTPTTSPQEVCLQRGQSPVGAVQSNTANAIFNIFESNGGKIPMSYADDAIVSFARLDLQDSDVPAVCSEHEVQVTGNEVPTPLSCTSLDGPVFTQVGLDETHTFISVVKNTLAFHGPAVMAPCVKSVFGGQFRLRRHCLVLECLTR